MAKYHISEDGRARVCTASSPEKCTAKGVDGGEAHHGDFSSSSEARVFAEQVLAKGVGGDSLSGLSKRSSPAASDGSTLANTAAKSSPPPRPNLRSIYDERPGTNIGVARVYGHLKGIEEDADSGRIDDSEVRSRISAVVDQLKALEEYNDTAIRPEAIAYRERLEALTDGAPAAKVLSEKDHWRQVQTALDSFENSSKYSAKQAFELNRVRDVLRGTAFNHDGYSETRALKLSEELGNSLARAKKPEAQAVVASIRAALAAEKKD